MLLNFFSSKPISSRASASFVAQTPILEPSLVFLSHNSYPSSEEVLVSSTFSIPRTFWFLTTSLRPCYHHHPAQHHILLTLLQQGPSGSLSPCTESPHYSGRSDPFNTSVRACYSFAQNCNSFHPKNESPLHHPLSPVLTFYSFLVHSCPGLPGLLFCFRTYAYNSWFPVSRVCLVLAPPRLTPSPSSSLSSEVTFSGRPTVITLF